MLNCCNLYLYKLKLHGKKLLIFPQLIDGKLSKLRTYIDIPLYIPYIHSMNATTKTSAFKSGNSIAVRLPKEFGIRAGEGLELTKRGQNIEIRRVVDPEYERAQVKELVRRLRALGPVDNPKPREPIEFPERSGLY